MVALASANTVTAVPHRVPPIDIIVADGRTSGLVGSKCIRSYQLSLDNLDLAFSNLIQIIKMRTSAGFVPSYTAGTVKSRDRSNPPVTAKVLHEITKRWGPAATGWVVELCFDDLLNWNTWQWTHRREAPLGLMAWGSDPYPYAPDGSASAQTGNGGGGASLESGLDNSVLGGGVPFNRTGRYVQDVYSDFDGVCSASPGSLLPARFRQHCRAASVSLSCATV